MQHDKLQDSAELFLRLRQGDTAPLRELYQTHRAAFIQFGKQYTDSEDDLADAFQDAIVAFYENVVAGKIEALQKSSVKTYLFGIGKFILFGKLKKQGRLSHHEPQDRIFELPVEEAEPAADAETLAALQRALDSLDAKNRALLDLYYFKKLSMEEIATRLGYKNANVAKSQKNRCMNRLRQLLA